MREGPGAKSSGAEDFACKWIEDMVAPWSSKKNVPIGPYKGQGLVFSTYKCICTRMGAKTANPKTFDFNDEILDLFMKKLSNDWNLTFADTIPEAFRDFAKLFEQRLKTFHEKMAARPALARAVPASLKTLEDQLRSHKAVMGDSIRSASVTVQAGQRCATRLFSKGVKDQVIPAYQKCVETSGELEEYHHSCCCCCAILTTLQEGALTPSSRTSC